MGEASFTLRARVSSDRVGAVRPVLERLVGTGSIFPGESSGELRVEGKLSGASARDLNRALLTELRRAEKKTRLRAEWTRDGVTERFFDYVPKGVRKA